MGFPERSEIWFEAKLDRDLALLFARIQQVHSRIGKARRAALLGRLGEAIADPAPEEAVQEARGQEISEEEGQ